MTAAAGRPEVRREKSWRKSSVAVPGAGFFGCALQRAGQCAVRGVGGTFDAVDGLDAPPRQGSPGSADGAGVRAAHGPSGLSGDVRSEEHTSELQSLMRISYAVFCLKKKNNT